MIKRGLIIFCLIFCIGCVSAQDIFVDKNNVGGGTCLDSYTRADNSLSQPFCTISRANEEHVGGDHVYILPGEYRKIMSPKAGIDESQKTIYSGYYLSGQGRETIKILGSEDLTVWNHYSGNIYWADHVVLVMTCGTDYVPTCWKNRNTWMNIEVSLSDVNTENDFYYDHANQRIYFYTVDAQPPTSRIECSQRMITMTGSGGLAGPNVIIQNLTIMHGAKNGIAIKDTGTNITIQNNEIMWNSGQFLIKAPYNCHDNPSAIYHAVFAAGYSPEVNDIDLFIPNVNIIGNKIHDQGCIAGSGVNISGSVDHSGTGIKFYGIKDSLIKDNEIYNVSVGISLKAKNHNITIQNNLIHDYSGRGMDLMAAISNINVYENVFYNSVPNIKTDVKAEGLAWGGNGILFGSYVFTNNITIFHNIFHNISPSDSGRGVVMDQSTDTELTESGQGSIIRNNIFSKIPYEIVKRRDDLSPSFISDNNSFYEISGFPIFWAGSTWSGSTLSLAEWQIYSGQEYNPILLTGSDALFNDVKGKDFTLDSASSLIDAGEFIPGYHCDTSGGTTPEGCRVWYGTAPDIGAFEYTGASASCTLTYDVEPCDCINDAELQNAVDAWFAGTLSTSNLYSHFQVWKTSSGC